MHSNPWSGKYAILLCRGGDGCKENSFVQENEILLIFPFVVLLRKFPCVGIRMLALTTKRVFARSSKSMLQEVQEYSKNVLPGHFYALEELCCFSQLKF